LHVYFRDFFSGLCRPSIKLVGTAGVTWREKRRRPRCAAIRKARRLHARLHHDAQKAELGAAQRVARVRLTNGFESDGLHPGEGITCRSHSIVMIRAGA